MSLSHWFIGKVASTDAILAVRWFLNVQLARSAAFLLCMCGFVMTCLSWNDTSVSRIWNLGYIPLLMSRLVSLMNVATNYFLCNFGLGLLKLRYCHIYKVQRHIYFSFLKLLEIDQFGLWIFYWFGLGLQLLTQHNALYYPSFLGATRMGLIVIIFDFSDFGLDVGTSLYSSDVIFCLYR